jgi:hypothetical protein
MSHAGDDPITRIIGRRRGLSERHFTNQPKQFKIRGHAPRCVALIRSTVEKRRPQKRRTRQLGVIAEDVPNPTLRTGWPKTPANRGCASIDFAGVFRAVAARPKTLVFGRSIWGHRGIFPKSYAKRLRGTLGAGFVGAGRHFRAFRLARRNRR